MSSKYWKALDSSNLSPPRSTLKDFDGIILHLQGVFQNFPIKVWGKMILVEVEIIDAPLYYNLMLG